MMAAHCSVDIALVPESVRRSIRMWRAAMRKRLYPASSRKRSRSPRVVCRSGSTLLMRNGSMMVRTAPLLFDDDRHAIAFHAAGGDVELVHSGVVDGGQLHFHLVEANVAGRQGRSGDGDRRAI